jgi:hypothetical protein
LAQKRPLRVIDVLAHPGYRCIGTCHIAFRNVQSTRKKEMLPFYTEGDRKLVRKPVEKVYGKEDY